ncbi:ABC-2 transporter permease [Humisphaera borealis]|uniref:DUF4203 domain-containing protein n=1 Tax=Humisphaera borealis TaxID=2807512 RepID=A0A7M2WY69_9BACT|nr:hypothetical protein [Humisphaera borealis]QOV90353.1 hypothetical protein IPV69_02995 [Humisphaera borealis]
MTLSVLTVLAAKASSKGGDSAFADFLTRFPEQTDLLKFAQNMGPGLAALLIIMGIVYLLFGFQIYRILVVLNSAAVGFVVGAAIGDLKGASIPCAIAGGVLAGAVSWPTTKYAVAVMGGLFGAMVAATIWRLLGQDPAFTWAGAMTGLVGGGLLCFIVFNGCVMAYMSLQGSTMLIFGLLGLLLKYQEIAPKVGDYLTLKPFVLPLFVFIPTVLGTMFQQNGATPPPAGAKK